MSLKCSFRFLFTVSSTLVCFLLLLGRVSVPIRDVLLHPRLNLYFSVVQGMREICNGFGHQSV